MLTALAYLLLAVLALAAIACVLMPFGLLTWLHDRGHAKRSAEADALLAEAEVLNAEAQALNARANAVSRVLNGI